MKRRACAGRVVRDRTVDDEERRRIARRGKVDNAAAAGAARVISRNRTVVDRGRSAAVDSASAGNRLVAGNRTTFYRQRTRVGNAAAEVPRVLDNPGFVDRQRLNIFNRSPLSHVAAGEPESMKCDVDLVVDDPVVDIENPPTVTGTLDAVRAMFRIDRKQLRSGSRDRQIIGNYRQLRQHLNYLRRSEQ